MNETVTQFDMCYIILLKGWALVNEWTGENTDTSWTLEQAALYHTLLPTQYSEAHL